MMLIEIYIDDDKEKMKKKQRAAEKVNYVYIRRKTIESTDHK